MEGNDTWNAGDRYEPYVGRWSRLVAKEFVDWLGVPAGLDWLDVGCGTGALTRKILERAAPGRVVGVDASAPFVEHARSHVADSRARFEVADARSLPFDAARFDAVVSALMLNFVPEPARAVDEMVRVARTGAVLAAYVWDYAQGMQMMRVFWDAAVALEGSDTVPDEATRFPMCSADGLAGLFGAAGIVDVQVRAIDVPTHFRDFDDYWSPFLGGQGPAPSYAMSLDESRRDGLREQIRSMLPIAADGSIELHARAWAARGRPRGA